MACHRPPLVGIEYTVETHPGTPGGHGRLTAHVSSPTMERSITKPPRCPSAKVRPPSWVTKVLDPKIHPSLPLVAKSMKGYDSRLSGYVTCNAGPTAVHVRPPSPDLTMVNAHEVSDVGDSE